MRAVVLAYSNIGCVGMRALLRHGFEIVAVFTHRDNPQETIWFDSVAELAATHSITGFRARGHQSSYVGRKDERVKT